MSPSFTHSLAGVGLFPTFFWWGRLVGMQRREWLSWERGRETDLGGEVSLGMGRDTSVKAQAKGVTTTETETQGQRGARLPRQSPSPRDPETEAGRAQENRNFGVSGRVDGHTGGGRVGHSLACSPWCLHRSPKWQKHSGSHRSLRTLREGATSSSPVRTKRVRRACPALAT